MDGIFRLADAIHLHDQMVVITADAYTHGTDSGWTMGDDPECLLSVPSDLLQMVFDRMWTRGRAPQWNTSVGFGRHYQEYPSSPVKLVELAVATFGNRNIEIKMLLEGENGDRWKEQWSYFGAYTIAWPAESQG